MALTPNQLKFLAAWAEIPTIRGASKKAGLATPQHYEWMKNSPEYAETFNEARRELVAALEHEAFRRGVEGWDEPVYQGGVQVGTVRKFDSSFVKMLLQANDPRYCDRHNHNVSGEIKGKTIVVLEGGDADSDG